MWAIQRGVVCGRAAFASSAAAPTLPTGNLTFHADASVVTDLWTVDSAGVFSAHPADTAAVNYWDDAEHGAYMLHASDSGTEPTWRSGTPLMVKPCLAFDGTDDHYSFRTDDDNSSVLLSSLISASAFTLFASIYVAGVSTNNANVEDNAALFTNDGQYWGVHFKHPSGYKIELYNYDGSRRVVELDISLNTSYVVMFRHESGTLYGSLNGGAETSTASGDTASLTGPARMGLASPAFNGRVGEVAIYNAALTGGTLSAALSYFTSKWL